MNNIFFFAILGCFCFAKVRKKMHKSDILSQIFTKSDTFGSFLVYFSLFLLFFGVRMSLNIFLYEGDKPDAVFLLFVFSNTCDVTKLFKGRRLDGGQ